MNVESIISVQKKKISLEKKILKTLKALRTIEKEVRSSGLSFQEGAKSIKSEVDIILSASKQIESEK